MSSNIMVYCEQRDGVLQNVSLELLGKARDLAYKLNGQVQAVLLGENVSHLAQTLINHGADVVFVADSPYLATYTTEPYTKALHHIVQSQNPAILLLGATALGRDLAPRLSCRCHTGLTADCTGLEIGEDGGLLMTRPAFGGNIMATILCPEHRPQMATVRPGVMEALPPSIRTGEIIFVDTRLCASDINVKVLEIVKEERHAADISEAKILVSAGRGAAGAEGLEQLNALAAALGGVVSASRAVVDEGRLPADRQVGQTGKTVRPALYLACGISGAIQHVAGMEGSDYIIAINKNPDAPIFDVADLGIVGDLRQIIPKLTAALNAGK